MTLTENGISTTTMPGQEQYEFFHAPKRPGKPAQKHCQYDYRHISGELFSCVAPTLEAARAKRDAWLASRTMSDDEYARMREGGLYLCPRCRSLKVEEVESLEWEDPAGSEETAIVKLQCNSCKVSWTEILRPVGFEMEE